MKKVPVLTYDRCVGYYAPTRDMNRGKKEEVSMRKRFDVNAFAIAEVEREKIPA